MFYALLSVQRFLESLYKTLVSLLRVLLRFRFRSGFRGTPIRKEELFILANGPGLKRDLEQYQALLKEKNLLVVNQFVLSNAFSELKPSRYVLLDIGFFLDRTIPRVIEVRNRLIEAFKEKTEWPLTLFVPAEGRNSVFHRELMASGKPFQFVFFNRTVAEGFTAFRHWIYRKNLGLPPPQNVLIGALMVALCDGFREIVVLGADHSWHLGLEVDMDGQLTSSENHFYDPKPWKVKVHHPETLEQAGIHDYFFNLYRTFRSYRLIRAYADSRGAKIINASSVTFIDAFERRSLVDYPWETFAER